MDRAATPERDRSINKSQERGHDPATPEVEGHISKTTMGPDEKYRGPEVEGHRVKATEQPGTGEVDVPEVEGHASQRTKI